MTPLGAQISFLHGPVLIGVRAVCRGHSIPVRGSRRGSPTTKRIRGKRNICHGFLSETLGERIEFESPSGGARRYETRTERSFTGLRIANYR